MASVSISDGAVLVSVNTERNRLLCLLEKIQLLVFEAKIVKEGENSL